MRHRRVAFLFRAVDSARSGFRTVVVDRVCHRELAENTVADPTSKKGESVVRGSRLVHVDGRLVEPVGRSLGDDLVEFLGSAELRVGLVGVFQLRPTELYGEFVVEVESDRFEERLGFERLPPAFDLRDRGVVGHVERTLGDDRSLVEVGRHVVGGDAGDAGSLFERLSVRGGAGKRGEQTRVNVDYLALITEDDLGRENADKARQRDQVDAVSYPSVILFRDIPSTSWRET